MKKIIFTILPVTLLTFGMTVFASPAHNAVDQSHGWCAFTDANGDGICDTCTGAGIHCAFADANGDGTCDNCAGAGAHCTFVDANGDGICDNGDWHCINFTDQNKDNICDNCTNQMCHSHAVSTAPAVTTIQVQAPAQSGSSSGSKSSGHHSSRHHGGHHS